MGIPYSRITPVSAVSGQATCFTLPAPTRGIVTRLIVKQIDGDSDGFFYDLYDALATCEASTSESVANPPADPAVSDRSMHRIIETKSVAAGNLIDQHFEKVWPYENQTEMDATSKRRSSAIYLELTPEGAGVKNFEIAYTIVQPELT